MKRIKNTVSLGNLIGILVSLSVGFALILFNAGISRAHGSGTPPLGSNSIRNKVQQIYTSQIGVREKGLNTGPEVEQYLRYVRLSKGNPWCAAFVCWVLGEAGVSNPRSGWSPDLFGERRVIWERGVSGIKYQESRYVGPNPNVFPSSRVNGIAPASRCTYPSSLAAGNWQRATRKEQGTKSKDQGLPPSAPIRFSSNPININQPAIRCAYPPLAGAGGGFTPFLPTTGDVFGLYFPEKKRIAHVGFIDQWDGTWMISVEGNTNVSGSREGDGVYRKRRLVRTIYKVARYINE